MDKIKHNIRMALLLLLTIVGAVNAFAEDDFTISTETSKVGVGQSVTLNVFFSDYEPWGQDCYYKFLYYTSEDSKKIEISTVHYNGSRASDSYKPTKEGIYYFVAQLSVDGRNYETADPAIVTVEKPTATISADKNTVDAGNSVTLTASTTYMSDQKYTFYCSKDNGATYSKISSLESDDTKAKYLLTQAGTYMFKVIAKGSSTATSEPISVTANAVTPYIKLTASDNSLSVNNVVTLTTTPICCNPESMTYKYDIDGGEKGTVIKTTSDKTCSFIIPEKTGTYKFYVNANINGNDYNSDKTAVTVTDAKYVSIGLSSDNFYAGEPFTITATPNTEASSYYYAYSTDEGKNYTYISDESCKDLLGIPITQNNTMSFTPTATGNYRLKIAANLNIEAYKDITVGKATDSPNVFNITYAGCEGHIKNSNQKYYNAKVGLTLKEPTSTGYDFVGWTYDGQTEPVKKVTIAAGSTGDKTFTAHWTPKTVTVTTLPSGWASYGNMTFNENVKLVAPTNGATPAKAYVCSDVNSNNATLKPVDVIAEYSGVFIKGDAGTTYTIQVTPEDPTDYERNYIVGVFTDTEISSDAYILASFNENGSTVSGLFRVDSAVTIPAGKAYIDVPTTATSNAKQLTMSILDDDATAIEQIENGETKIENSGKFVQDGHLVIVKNGKQYNATGMRIK